MQMYSFHITSGQLDALRERSAVVGASVSQQIRWAIDAYLHGHAVIVPLASGSVAAFSGSYSFAGGR